MNEIETNHGNERLTKVETEVSGIREEMVGMWRTLRDIQDSLNKANKTDWNTIFAGLVLLGALWASAIHPISADMERTSRVADKIAEAVIIQNNRIDANDTQEKLTTAEVAALRTTVQYMNEHGTTGSDKRLAIIEMRLQEKKQ